MISIKHHAGEYDVESIAASQSFPTSVQPGDCLLTDDNLAKLYPELVNQFQNVALVTPGEQSKSLSTFGAVLSQFVKGGVHRTSRLWALGGGVIGDLGGFVAATLLRGIPLIQVPTSLLAMVDSSVGGKVGINLPEGKNLVGGFSPPSRVILDIGFLQSLPPRQLINGMAEVWKYGYICDATLLPILRNLKPEPDRRALEPIVESCIRLKAAIVEGDEFETNGRRAILNFGHTVGHAIEKTLGYDVLLHGEAVSIGMVLEAKLGEKLGITETGTADQIALDLQTAGLPTTLPEALSIESLVVTMRMDKKSNSSGLGFSFLH